MNTLKPLGAAVISAVFLLSSAPVRAETVVITPQANGTENLAIRSADFPTQDTLSTAKISRALDTKEILQRYQFTGADGDCIRQGNTVFGSTTCTQQLANGHRRTLEENHEEQGTLYKKQTVIREQNENGKEVHRHSVRYRADYKELDEDRRVPVAERFDIVTRPTEGPITREWIVLEYHENTHVVKKITWVEYHQIGESSFAEIARHAYLIYDGEGKPKKGRVELWDDREVQEKLYDWNTARQPGESQNWQEWEAWFYHKLISAVTA